MKLPQAAVATFLGFEIVVTSILLFNFQIIRRITSNLHIVPSLSVVSRDIGHSVKFGKVFAKDVKTQYYDLKR